MCIRDRHDTIGVASLRSSVCFLRAEGERTAARRDAESIERDGGWGVLHFAFSGSPNGFAHGSIFGGAAGLGAFLVRHRGNPRACPPTPNHFFRPVAFHEAHVTVCPPTVLF